ncbi:radical SAM protein [candidate division KSB1 bacterium]|nr:radical SAM protein [candidate division KSB1 bacterium]
MVQCHIAIQQLQSGGLITNYYCSSTCAHCLYRCSPAWPKDFITSDAARKAMATIQQLGCSAIHIGGGEPLLNIDGLIEALHVAREMDMDIDYVETNASWFRDPIRGRDTLVRLRNAGLSTLLISISPFHNEHIPFIRTRGLIEACQDVGIGVFPWISNFIGDLQQFDETVPHDLSAYQHHFGEDYLENLPNRYWISKGGRALETFAPFQRRIPLDELLTLEQSGCSELMVTSHFHIDLYGNYVPGLCSGISIRQNDLGTQLIDADYPLINLLYHSGISGLLSYAEKDFSFVPAQEAYGIKCKLCYEIRRFLVIKKGWKSHELQPEGHYRFG